MFVRMTSWNTRMVRTSGWRVGDTRMVRWYVTPGWCVYSFMLIWIGPENAGNRGVLKFGPHVGAGMRGLGWGLGLPAFSGQPPDFVS